MKHARFAKISQNRISVTLFCDIFRDNFLSLRRKPSITGYGKGNIIPIEEGGLARRTSDIGAFRHYAHQPSSVQILHIGSAGVFR